MQYALTLRMVGTATFSTALAYSPDLEHNQIAPGMNDLLGMSRIVNAVHAQSAASAVTEPPAVTGTSTAIMDVTGVETITTEDHYVASAQPVVTMTTVAAEPQATKFDMRQCIAEGKVVEACEQERKNLKEAISPIPEGGACFHSEGLAHYHYFVGGSGKWAGKNCANIERAVREIDFNKVTEFTCDLVSSPLGPTGQWKATWRMLPGSRHAVEKHLHRLPGAPPHLSCAEKVEDVVKEAALREKAATQGGGSARKTAISAKNGGGSSS